MLLARNHHNLDSLKFHDMLRSAAAFAGDRTVLYHLIHEKTGKSGAPEQDKSTELSGRLSDILKKESREEELDIAPAYSVEDVPVKNEEPIKEEEKEISGPSIDEYTFTGWFDHVSETPESPASSKNKGSDDSRQDLIDKFLEESPRIQADPERKTDDTDRAKLSAIDENTPMTETLAKIYARQGKFKKAIYAYEKLSLKYPEKSTYFASQINRLKSNLEE
jgi:hypothetical protein